jgi:hypothetical protein
MAAVGVVEVLMGLTRVIREWKEAEYLCLVEAVEEQLVGWQVRVEMRNALAGAVKRSVEAQVALAVWAVGQAVVVGLVVAVEQVVVVEQVLVVEQVVAVGQAALSVWAVGLAFAVAQGVAVEQRVVVEQVVAVGQDVVVQQVVVVRQVAVPRVEVEWWKRCYFALQDG